MQQHVVLRNSSGYRWTASEVSTKQIDLGWCLTHADMPDFSQIPRMNESVSVWAPTGGEYTDSRSTSLRVVSNGEPYKITAIRSENPSLIVQVEGARMAMVEQNPSDRCSEMPISGPNVCDAHMADLEPLGYRSEAALD